MAIITLKHPIIVNDQQVVSVEIPDRMKLKHMRALDSASGEIGKVAALIGSMANLPMSAVDQIDAEDFAGFAEVFGGFLAQLPATGEK